MNKIGKVLILITVFIGCFQANARWTRYWQRSLPYLKRFGSAAKKGLKEKVHYFQSGPIQKYVIGDTNPIDKIRQLGKKGYKIMFIRPVSYSSKMGYLIRKRSPFKRDLSKLLYGEGAGKILEGQNIKRFNFLRNVPDL